MQTILITGGAGFIGTHLAARAAALGYRLRVLDNLSAQIHGPDARYKAPASAIEFIHGDIRDRECVRCALTGVEMIVHLAAETGTGQSMYEIQRYYEVNVQATANLFDLLANEPHSIRRVVLASSRSVYGEGAYSCPDCSEAGERRYPKSRSADALAAHKWDPLCPVCEAVLVPVPTREDDALSPASIYAATKLAQEDLVRISCASLGLDHAILRFQNVFGEGQSLNNPYTGILSIFSTRIRLGLSLPIFEDGQETRDFVHVSDVVGALMRCIEAEGGIAAVVNVGSGAGTSVMDVARLLIASMNGNIEPQVTEQYRLGDIRHNFADIAALEGILGYRPMMPLDKGLDQFCDWVRTQPIPEDMLEKANAELKARNLMG
jgi:dTDP-L-rhamnose 4-epimerase